ncbi:MAG: hypothetical protein AB1801_17410 [Chloroflexota bacterium]
MNLNVTIERLILDGLDLPPHLRPHLQTAVEAELTRLLADGGLSPSLQGGGAKPYLPARNIQLTESSHPAELGQQIARAVYGGIGR